MSTETARTVLATVLGAKAAARVLSQALVEVKREANDRYFAGMLRPFVPASAPKAASTPASPTVPVISGRARPTLAQRVLR